MLRGAPGRTSSYRPAIRRSMNRARHLPTVPWVSSRRAAIELLASPSALLRTIRARVLSDALKQGRRVADSCKFYLQFGSQETREYCVRKGYLDIFKRVGAIVIEPSCGACINAGPGVSTRPDQVVISAQNRNFPGRSGPGQMYLASPLTVAASAVAGYIVEYEPSEKTELVGA